MSKTLTPDEEARYAELAARMEAGDHGPIPAGGDPAAAAELDDLLGEADDLDADESAPTPPPPPAGEAVSAAEVHAVLGRPSLAGSGSRGTSPKRQVRLPADLNDALNARASLENRNASAIMRDAIEQYLRAS